jgi:hypothetical protein
MFYLAQENPTYIKLISIIDIRIRGNICINPLTLWNTVILRVGITPENITKTKMNARADIETTIIEA